MRELLESQIFKIKIKTLMPPFLKHAKTQSENTNNLNKTL